MATPSNPDHRSRRRAAVTVLTFPAVFALLQVAFHSPAAVVYPQLRDANFGRKLVRLREVAAVARADARPLVIMTGSSLTEFAFRPGEMAGQDGSEAGRPICYNFGLRNTGVIVQLLSLRRILDEGIRPDLVLVEIFPQFLYPQFSGLYDGDILPPERVFWGDWPTLDRTLGDTAEYRRRWRDKQILPWWSYREETQFWLDPALIPKGRNRPFYPMDEWGFPIAVPGAAERPTGYQLNGGGAFIRAHYGHYYAHTAHDPRLAEAYCGMAALCREYGVRCALVAVPESSFTREACPSDGTSPYARLLEQFRRENLAEVIDARNWITDEEFIDGTHLLRPGATRFSQRLERDVLRRVFPPGR